MYKNVIIILFTLTITSVVLSQDVINTITVDKETYTLWSTGDWDKLILIGEAALKHGIDFYYLQARLGIAYFEKGNYHAAIHHFENAVTKNSNEPLIIKYLYYANLYSGRVSEADYIATAFNEKQKKEIGIADRKLIDQIWIAYNNNYLNNDSIIDNFSINIDDNQDGSQFITNSFKYLSINFKHKINPKFSLFHGYSNIDKTSFRYTQESSASKSFPDYNVTLHQYYLSANLRIAKNINILFGTHYLNIRYPNIVFDSEQNSLILASDNIVDNDLIGFLAIFKDFEYYKLGASINYSGLNDITQLQNNILFTVYPKGNLNLYTTSTFSYQTEKYATNQSINRFVFDQLIGIKLTNNLWIEGFVTIGDIHNFLQNNGFVVYNGLNTIKNKYGGRLLIPLDSPLQILIDYSYLKTESSFTPTLFENAISNTLQYNNHSITVGLSWEF